MEKAGPRGPQKQSWRQVPTAAICPPSRPLECGLVGFPIVCSQRWPETESRVPVMVYRALGMVFGEGQWPGMAAVPTWGGAYRSHHHQG